MMTWLRVELERVNVRLRALEAERDVLLRALGEGSEQDGLARQAPEQRDAVVQSAPRVLSDEEREQVRLAVLDLVAGAGGRLHYDPVYALLEARGASGKMMSGLCGARLLLLEEDREHYVLTARGRERLAAARALDAV